MRSLRLITASLVVLLAVLVAGCGGADEADEADSETTSTTRQATTTTAPAPVTYRYEVEGPSSATVIYTDGAGETVEQTVPLPWSVEITDEDGFPSYSIAVAALAGPVTCRIVQDSEVLDEQTSSGSFPIMSCSADPPESSP
jgi:hypothetical protein